MISIDGYGEHGIITDLQAHRLPPNAWSNGKNVRFAHGEAQKITGEYGLASVPDDIVFAIPFVVDPDYYWIMCSSNRVYRWDGADLLDITPSGGLNTSTRWNGGVVAGVVVLNNTIDAPIYYATSMTDAESLPGWDSNWRADVIRAYRNFWLAGNMIESDLRYPTRYRWSDAFEPGAVPTTWTAAADNLAGDDVLEQSQDSIIEFEPLRDYLVAYKQHSAYLLSYIGGSFVLDNRLVFKTNGIIGQNCVKEFMGKHFVACDGDIIVHNGQDSESIVNGLVKNAIFNDIDPANYTKCFVAQNHAQEEMWFCYPVIGTSRPSKAAIWNWRSGKWSFRDLDRVMHMDYGVVPSQAENGYWDHPDNATMYWGESTRSWNDRTYNPVKRSMVMVRPDTDGLHPSIGLTPSVGLRPSGGSSTLAIADFGLDFNGEEIDSFIERRGLKPGDKDGVFMCRAVYPRGEGGEMLITVGAHDSPNAPIRWGTPTAFTPGGSTDKVDTRVTGRYLAIKVQFTGANCVLFGADFDVVQVGTR